VVVRQLVSLQVVRCFHRYLGELNWRTTLALLFERFCWKKKVRGGTGLVLLVEFGYRFYVGFVNSAVNVTDAPLE